MKHAKIALLCTLLSLCFSVFMSVSCSGQTPSSEDTAPPEGTGETDPPLPATPPYDSNPKVESVIKVCFTGPTAAVNLHDLDNHSVYLMKVNKNKYDVVSADDTGSVVTYTGAPEAGNEEKAVEEMFVRETEHPSFVCGTDNNAASRYPLPGATYTEVLRGAYGRFLVSDNLLSTVTLEQVRRVSDLFDVIYPIEAKPFGFDKVNSSRVKFIIHDNAGGGAGNSYAGDTIYLDEETVIQSETVECAGVLIHEFFHYLQFTLDPVVHGNSFHSEGLAELAVDVFGPFVGIPITKRGHPVQFEMEVALQRYYNQGFDEWIDADVGRYKIAYAFWAYMVRNYGGMELYKNLILDVSSPPSRIEELVTTALQKTLPGTDLDFDKVLAKYAEAFVFSGASIPEGVASFDKTVTTTIDGTDYTFTGIPVWDTIIPSFFPVNTAKEMRPQSVMMHYSPKAWGGRTGDFSVTLQKPNSDDVELYLMIRKKTGVL